MSSGGIPLDEAELLSALMEGFLYGFSLLMFGVAAWVIWPRRSTRKKVSRRMLVVACSLLLFSTAHFVIDIIRIMQGLITFRDTYPGGPVGYFSDASQWTFVYKNYVYAGQTLIGDGVVLYRCYAVWQSKLVMILPALLWCAVGVTGIASPYTASQAAQVNVFGGGLYGWVTAFYASTITTNLLTTLLLAYRIWSVDRQTSRAFGHRRSQLRPVLHIVIDSGVIYSVTLLAALICFVNESNGQFVILDMLTPIVSITFYLVIIRVGLANRATTSASRSFALGTASDGTDRKRGMQVHIPTLADTKTEHGPHPSTDPMTPLDDEHGARSESRVDAIGAA